jgi:hypothetical protein
VGRRELVEHLGAGRHVPVLPDDRFKTELGRVVLVVEPVALGDGIYTGDVYNLDPVLSSW